MARPRIRVVRKISDKYGDLLPGDLPSLERVAEWPENNFRSMTKARFIEVYGGTESPTHFTAAEEKPAQKPPRAPYGSKKKKFATRKVVKKTGRRT